MILMQADDPVTRKWFVGDFVPEILALVLDVWEEFQLNKSVRLEQRITNLFADALERAYEKQSKSWFLFPDLKHTDPKTGKELARHDLRFFHRGVSGQQLYFIFECKRLNVISKKGHIVPNSSGYTAGMVRFVNGKYSANHQCGGMIGFVMDGKVAAASRAIKARMQKRRVELCITDKGDYACSALMPKHAHNGETKHKRKKDEFVIYHLLMTLN